MLNSSTQPPGHHPEGGGRLGAGSGSLAGNPGGGADTALLGSLLSSLSKARRALTTTLVRARNLRPVHSTSQSVTFVRNVALLKDAWQ